MADPTIADIKALAEEAVAARDLANNCLPIEYHDYSNKATAAHEKYWNALGKLQPDDFLAKLALSPPQDVAGIAEELQTLYLHHHFSVAFKAADALLSLSARNRELEGAYATLREKHLALLTLAQEGENRGLEKAAKVAGNYIQSNDTRDVRSDSLKEYLKGAAEASQKIAAAIRALIPQEQGEKGK